ncbi:MAG: transglutaminase-like domain-containing protein [Thermodesulfovibrionales bacterium]
MFDGRNFLGGNDLKRSYIHLLLLSFYFIFLPSLTEASDVSLEKDLQRRLEESRHLVLKAIEKLRAVSPIADEITKLKANTGGIRATDVLLQERFRLREEEVKSKGPKAQERQRVMSEGYRKALAEYLSLVDSLPPDGKNAEAALENLKTFLDRTLKKKKKQIFGSLPYTHLNYSAKEPSADPPITPAYKGGNKTVSPDDLTETAEAPISEEIATLAQSLNWNPVSIYEYVKNTIETEWYWGCMKGAEETLHQGSGNDCDQAALFVALLRASGFPSRYVRGTIQFFPDISKAQNLTGIDDPSKIAEFFQKAGIPFSPIMSGGTISNFQIEHIWVESQIPYANYRGAVIDEQGKTWLGLDTSIKVNPYNYNNPLDILQEFSLSTTRDEYLTAIQTQTPLEYIETEIGNYLSQSHPDETYNDLLLTKTLTPEVMNILPASMQFDQKTITHEYTEIPDELKHQMTFTATDMNNNALFAITLDVLDLSNQTITLSYEPETVEDQQIIDSYGGMDNTPAYLVNLRPILELNGEMVVAGSNGLPMGADHNLTIEITSPNGSQTIESTQITGNLTVIGIAAQKTESNQLLTIAADDDAEEILFKETQNYINRWNQAENELTSLMHLIFTRPIPTVVSIGGVIDVTYLLDTPQGYEWKGVYVDAKLRAAETEAGAQNAGDRGQTFMQLSALQGSILENRIFEDDFQVDSISTAKLFELANSNQTPLLVINTANISAVLPSLLFDTDIIEDITNAINQNLTVTIPNQDITYEDWTGIAYIKENLDTGESGHMLSGMIAGGSTAQTPEQWANQYLRQLLGKPFKGKPNTDPMSAATIIKIPVTDGKYGTVNQPLPQPLAVLVLDEKGIPVLGASVTFNVIAGNGNFNGNYSFTIATASTGIAKAPLILGKNTADNPSYIKLNTGDASVTQVGLNIITASANGASGSISIVQPFSAYGKPDVPAQIIKVLGDGNSAMTNNPGGSLIAKVVDQYGNPISNVVVNFNALDAESREPLVPLPSNYRNIQFYQQGQCTVPYPLYGECTTVGQMSVETQYYGSTVNTMLGNTVNTTYTVQASALNLSPAAFNLYSMGFRSKDDYIPPGIYIQYAPLVNDQGQPVNASKVGTQLNAPLVVELFEMYDDYTLAPLSDGTWQLVLSGTVSIKPLGNGTVTFTSTQGSGTTTPTQNLANGRYQTLYTTGPVPMENIVVVSGAASITVPEVLLAGISGDCLPMLLPSFSGDPSSNPNYKPQCATAQTIYQTGYLNCTGNICDFPQMTVNLTSGQQITFNPGQQIAGSQQTDQYSVYGVDVQLTADPEELSLDENGYLIGNMVFTYTILPPEYNALTADVDLFELDQDNNQTWLGSIPGDNTQGTGTAGIVAGTAFDMNMTYEEQAVLNEGTDIEIRGDMIIPQVECDQCSSDGNGGL